ncbi:CTD small phosphatase-like protein [Quillaja saponaria]|uniref:Mitochondrial import inner membrane translocase subunit TIM50 n=1 Tax=Quillaja saponaria TaxID=32244 RepID=A0AAD7PUL2_QUISA|nr:CTD small phosphatase-like protein [Quillaja saponaria]
MVSKIKKTPTKSIKDRRSNSRRHGKRTPIKNVAAATTSAVLASIHKSLFTCQRRLTKIFSKLARINTPNRHRGFRILKKNLPEEDEEFEEPSFNSIRRSLVFNNRLPPLISPDKRTIFLDLDETLIHSKADPPPERFDFVPSSRSLSSQAGLKEYASLVLDRLDRKALISHRLYRDSCKEVEGRYVKDLSEMGRDLKRVVIVDDNPNSYAYQPENAIQIQPFIDDLDDQELQRLIGFFEGSDCFDDMRDAVKHYIAVEDKTLNL